jgi:hypothetical protein
MGKRETTMACRSLVAFLGKPSSSLGENLKDCQNMCANSLRNVLIYQLGKFQKKKK